MLSLVGDPRCAIYSLGDVKAWLTAVGLYDTEFSAIVNDSERFVLCFYEFERSCHMNQMQSWFRMVRMQLTSLSPCETMVVSGSNDKIVPIWILSSYDCQCILKGHSDHVYAIY